jgi:broad specificity phosphatase PhoE
VLSNPSAQATLLVFVRHGETLWNLDRRFQGQLDIPLSEQGKKQAEAAAGWLTDQQMRFAAIYSSDLQRALQTAEPISRRLGLPIIRVPELRELHCGVWQGLTVDEVEALYPGEQQRWHDTIDTFTLPGGESIPDVQRRVLPFIKRIAERHKGEAVIVVSHGAALASLIAAIHDWDLVETWRTKRARMGNTGVTAMLVDQATDENSLLLFNSTGHLSEPADLQPPLVKA